MRACNRSYWAQAGRSLHFFIFLFFLGQWWLNGYKVTAQKVGVQAPPTPPNWHCWALEHGPQPFLLQGRCIITESALWPKRPNRLGDVKKRTPLCCNVYVTHKVFLIQMISPEFPHGFSHSSEMKEAQLNIGLDCEPQFTANNDFPHWYADLLYVMDYNNAYRLVVYFQMMKCYWLRCSRKFCIW